MIRKTIFTLLCIISICSINAQHIIHVSPEGGDMTKKVQQAIEQARNLKGKAVVIQLQNADYNLHRDSSSKVVYHISNTTSEQENPDQTKHIGLWLKGLKNVTIDGQGARFVTHGELTPFAIDDCQNITLKNFTVTADDPTVPELTVQEVGSNFMTVRIHPQSRYKVENGKFSFVGDNWTLSGGIAQGYSAESDITWRGWSPLSGLKKAIELDKNLLRFVYDDKPQASVGTVFQMRDAIRNEACGLIQYSKGVTVENVHFAFTGNFGIVGQMAEDITYRNLVFEPEYGSGRTCSGFADFVQMSGCKGKLTIENSRFVGAHDDPINIHGTHLAVTEYLESNKITVRYMHPQSFGFQSFLPGNEIEFIDPNSLLALSKAKVKSAEMKNDREIIVTLDRNVPQDIKSIKGLVVENITYTPEVEIRGNYFSRIPTRGILVTTRRKVLIEDNTFFRMQMSGILIADDARSWYESGMVRDVTIRNNNFIECGGPVISISPENNRNDGYVHSNINIINNRFDLVGNNAISAKSVDGLNVVDNLFITSNDVSVTDLVHTNECVGVEIKANSVQKK